MSDLSDSLMSEKDKLTTLAQELFWKLVEEFVVLEERLAYYQEKLESLYPICTNITMSRVLAL